MSNKMPFKNPVTNLIGRGQDSIVVGFKGDVTKVLKWDHDKIDRNTKKSKLSVDEHFQRVLYLKNKYEILCLFLGDFIPESFFLVGSKLDGKIDKIKEYTIQERIKGITINQLTPEQINHPIFQYNLYLLFKKLSIMHNIIGKLNKSIGGDEKIDARLDLGGLTGNILNMYKMIRLCRSIWI